MIAIFSKRDFDPSTEDVIDWLHYLGADFTRINGADFVGTVSLSSFNFTSISHFDDINMCWLRRWMDEEYFVNLLQPLTELPYAFAASMSTHLRVEAGALDSWLFEKLWNKKWLSHPLEIRISKLKVLHAAFTLGLAIPDTIITSQREDLISFKNKHSRIISKCIKDIPNLVDKDMWYSLKTVEVDLNFIETLPETFFPSSFQELIEKEYELRIVYLNKAFFPMVIFSQLDAQTELDFRYYNRKKPNRTAPYKLPVEIEEKLQLLVDNLGMTTGSIDMIKDKEGRFVLLEINAVGQFGMTSKPCNYFIEKEIARHLIANDNSHTK